MKAKKIVLFLTALTLILGGCSSTATGPKNEGASTTGLSQQIADAVLESMKEEDRAQFSPIEKENYKEFYGIDPEEFNDVVIMGALINVRAHELIIIETKDDKESMTAAKDTLEKRKQLLLDVWSNYLPDMLEMVKEGVIVSDGIYAALIIAPEPKEAAKAFDSAAV